MDNKKDEYDIELERDMKIEKEESGNEFTKVEDIIQTESGGSVKIRIKVINVLVILISLVSVIVLIYIFTDLLKTNEQNFTKYLYITSKNIENLRTDELEKYFEKTKYTSDGEVSLTTDEEKAKVKFNGKTNVENRLKETNIVTDYNGKELEINYKQDKDTYAIKIDEIYNKYIAIENNNLKELVNLLGLNNERIPNRIDLEKYKFKEKELKNIKRRYIRIIKNEVSKENYLKEKNDEYNIYKLSLTNKQLNNIKIKMLQELKNDNVLLEKYIIYEQINGKKILKEDLKKEIESKVKELEENTSEQEKDVLLIYLYTKLNKCEKIEIKSLEGTINIEIYSNYLKVIMEQHNNKICFEIQKEEVLQELKYNIKMVNQNYDFYINLKFSELSENKVKEEYDINFDNSIKLNYINKTVQDEDIIIKKLEDSECDVLNSLNKDKINSLIYKIYNNIKNL